MSIWDTITANPLQTAAVAISALILLTSITLYYKNKRIKKLSYSILTDTTITPHSEELSGRIKLCYEENPGDLVSIRDGRLFVIKFSNDGKEPIKPADFTEPISISLDPQATILDKDIIECPDALEKPKLDICQNIAILKPLLLNEHDYVTIKLLLTGSKEKTDFRIRARIVGVTSIKSVEDERRVSPVFLAMSAAIIGGLVSQIFYIKSETLLRLLREYSPIVPYIILVVGSASLIITIYARIYKKT